MASVQDPTHVPAAGESNDPAAKSGAPAPADCAEATPLVRQSSDIAGVVERVELFRPDCVADLPPDQEVALVAIMEGKGALVTARRAGVSRSTIHRWRTRDPRFIAAMNLWRREVKQSIGDSMALMTEKALAILAAALDKQDLRAAMIVLNFMKRQSFGPADLDAVTRRQGRRARKIQLAEAELDAREDAATTPKIYRDYAREMLRLLNVAKAKPK
jgi:hypothetical protein